MTINPDDFKPITVEDRDNFQEIYKKHPITHSESSFGTLFCWKQYAQTEFLITRGNVIVRTTVDGNVTYRAPIGTADDSVLRDVMDLACATGNARPLFLFEEDQIEAYQALYPQHVFREDRNFFDYIYRTEMLAKLPGKEYLTIRKQLHKFHRSADPSVEEVSAENMEEILEFLQKWCKWHECDKYEILKHEGIALHTALEHFDALHLAGIVVRSGIDGGIIGVSVYEELSPDTLVVHHEKGLHENEGVYKELVNALAVRTEGKYQFIDRESDMGVPGLRNSKTRYHPDHFRKLFYLDLEG
ncbi:MAG: phosphatidylglycerol lysyltransferase domain-containing protein [Euryarchaeota archaeon]|nr:phosphatidylglycerol lysyltransferase domain-containing protein [Euryarchaeota archaeon]